jgi:hypothetical protein
MREDASPHLIFFFQAFFQMDATFCRALGRLSTQKWFLQGLGFSLLKFGNGKEGKALSPSSQGRNGLNSPDSKLKSYPKKCLYPSV